MKTAMMINSLIEKETEIVKTYENYLVSVPIQELSGMAKTSIVRHNNHIKALKDLAGRY